LFFLTVTRVRLPTELPPVLMLSILGLFGDPSVDLRYTVPAQKNISKYSRLAVIEFEGRGASRVRSELEANLLDAKVDGVPYFTLVSRDRLDRVLQEQSKGQSVRFDDRSTVAIGKLLGADALVTGMVTEYHADERRDTETRQHTEGKKEKKRTVSETYYCVQHEARVRADVKFIDARTAAVIAAVPLSGSASDGGCMQDSYPTTASDDALFDQAMSKMGNELRMLIAPHEVVRSVKLRTKDKDKGVSERLKRGVDYAKSGGWDMSIEEWEQAVQQNPDSAPAHYNLGVAREAQGQLERAQEHYKKAARIDPDKLYVSAVIAVNERLKMADELQRQMEGRKSDDQ
jgi:curli biogenesis system outer membrane secretion channel CsgG